MKTMRHIESENLVLVIAFGIGLGLAVHAAFFYVALGTIVFAAGQAIAEHRRAHHRHT